MIEAELPDGTILEFPEGTSPEVMKAAVQRMGKPAKPSFGQQFKKEALSSLPVQLGLGAIRGAGSIGATAMRALPNLFGGDTAQENAERRQKMDQALQSLGAGTDSLAYGAGKIGAEIAGTAGAGGVLARGASMIPSLAARAPSLIEALRTGGMSAAGKPGLASLPARVVGGAAVGGASAAMVNPEDAGMGAAFGGALPVIGQSIASASQFVSPERLMQSALKPTLAQQKSGEAKAAVDTLLKYGINATKGGAEKLRGMVQGADDEISGLLSNSVADVSKKDILSRMGDVRGKFASQVNPSADIASIQKVADDFSSHPLFASYAPKKEAAENALAKAISEKQTALQAAGKLQTFAAQQRELAHGATIQLAKEQPQNQLYFNVNGLGKTATSPSSLFVPGYPRIPGRYTNNIDRVPEGLEGADEAMAIYAAKKLEEQNARQMLEQIVKKGETISVQDAQRLKQGTYKTLEKKYGQLGSAEVEAQKALARGLKETIAEKVPEVAGLNAKQSELIKALNVTSRRALMDDNANMIGIAGLSPSPSQLLMMLADRSALAKSLAARGANALRPEDNALLEALRSGVYKAAPLMPGQTGQSQ